MPKLKMYKQDGSAAGEITLSEEVFGAPLNLSLIHISARKYADYLGTAVAIGDKTRTGHDENAHILELIGDVEGKNCMIVDDFTISGGTLVDIANMLREKGAKKIIAVLAHNMLREKGVKKIDDSPIEMLISTDTVENPFILASKKMVTVSVAPLFAEAVLRIHERVTVSTLFQHVPSKVVEQMR